MSKESIWEAAQSGNIAAIQVRLNEGVDVNAINSNKWTALIYAANSGRLDTVKWLAEHGADVNAKDSIGYTAFLRAVESRHLEMAKWLVNEKGADVNAKAKDGITALSYAAIKGHLEMAKWLVNEKGADVNAKDSIGYTAFLKAVQSGHLEMAKWLVNEKAADVNAKANNGDTALLVAAMRGHLEMAKWLVDEKAADVNAKNGSGYTALLLALNSRYLEMAKWLVNEKGADVNVKHANGKTPLIIATEFKDLNLVKALLDAGANVDEIVADTQTTALHIACTTEQPEIAKLLLANGANTVLKDINGKTALDIVWTSKNIELVELLLHAILLDAKAPDDLKIKAQMRINEIEHQKTLTEIMEKVAEGNDRISGGESHAILLFGNTGSGKSTLTHILSKKPLQYCVNKEFDKIVLDTIDEDDPGSIKINHSKSSETKIPNKCFATIGDRQVVVWDCPGFNDTEIGQNIANSVYIKKLYAQHQNIKFLLVMSVDALAEKGSSFVRTLEQFCNNFTDIDRVMDGTTLVITGVSPIRREEALLKEIEGINKSHKDLSKNAKKVLEHISLNKKIVLFHAPAVFLAHDAEPQLLDPAIVEHIVQEIEEKSNYITSKDEKGNDIGKFHLPDIAVSLCKSLLDMSTGNLEFVFKVLNEVTDDSKGAGSSGNAFMQNKGIFEKHYETIKQWLPKTINYIREREPVKHEANEFFLSVKHLAKLKEKIELYKAQTVQNISMQSDSGTGTAEIRDFEYLINFVENLLNVSEEYTLDMGLRTKIQHMAYAGIQMKECCKLFSSLIDGKTIDDKIFNQKTELAGLTQRLKAIVEEVVKIIDTKSQGAIVKLDIEASGVNNTSEQVKYHLEAIKLLKLYSQEPECVKKQAQSYYKIGVLKKAAGESHEDEMEIRAAIKYYVEALRLDNTIVEAYADLGNIYFDKQDYREAIKFYKVTNNSVQLRKCYKTLIDENEKDYHLREEYGDVWKSFAVYAKAAKYYTDAIGLTTNPAVLKDLVIKRADCLSSDVIANKAKQDVQQAQSGIFYNFDQAKEEIDMLSKMAGVVEEWGFE